MCVGKDLMNTQRLDAKVGQGHSINEKQKCYNYMHTVGQETTQESKDGAFICLPPTKFTLRAEPHSNSLKIKGGSACKGLPIGPFSNTGVETICGLSLLLGLVPTQKDFFAALWVAFLTKKDYYIF